MSSRLPLAGIGYGLLAYLIWGFFPLYFRQLGHISPMDILSNRTLWAFVFVAALLTLRRRWSKVIGVFQAPRQLARLSLAALLLGSNWLGFLWAVDHQQVVAASFGYFLTPLVNVLLGLLVLKERLNGKEWLAIGLAVVAVINELIALGTLPWISLFLAATFGTYGLLRKQVPVDALSGLWLETLAMLPVCLIYAAWQGGQGHAVFTLAVSGYEMYSSHEWSELHDDVQKYIEARQTYGLSLLRMLTQHGLYVNGILHYQLRHVNNQLMMLEKLQIPLTDVQLHKRNLARQADLASRRVVSAFDARTAIPRNR